MTTFEYLTRTAFLKNPSHHLDRVFAGEVLLLRKAGVSILMSAQEQTDLSEFLPELIPAPHSTVYCRCGCGTRFNWSVSAQRHEVWSPCDGVDGEVRVAEEIAACPRCNRIIERFWTDRGAPQQRHTPDAESNHAVFFTVIGGEP